MREYLTAQQVADLLSTTLRTVRRNIQKGRLKSSRVGGLRRVAVEDFERFARGR